ncbi:site-2 protease family protein [Patescibacteria group bacterium]|nr:site-2 protease family protein [Patescibacteria group bacterium]MBZ9578529.1 site-2 protease family protein [Patescibacteria group bacterium]
METIIFSLIILLFSVVIHEVSHGVMADYLGDPTAKYAGRLSLNPVRHLDFFGSIILPLITYFLFGFPIGAAKPVPINPYNFRNPKYDGVKVALAGPGANLFIALFFGLVIRFFPALSAFPGFYLMFSYIVTINLLLAIFNLLPVPPLDGSHVIFALLPRSMENIKIFLRQYWLFVLFFLIFSLQLIWPLIFKLLSWIFRLIVGVPAPFF